MTMSFSDNCIHLPIAQTLAGMHDSRPRVDACSILEHSTPLAAPAAHPALFLTA